MPRLSLNDGYTLDGTADHAGYTLTYAYRPALPDAIEAWRHAVRGAGSGSAEVEATAKLVRDHLVSWDLTDKDGKPAPLSVDVVRRLPEPFLNAVLKAVTTWAGPKMEADAKN